MRRAISALEARLDQPEVVAPLCGTKEMPGPIVLRDLNGRWHLTATLSALMHAISARDDAPTTCLMSMLQGNHYNQIGMIASGGAFDFVLPSHCDLPLSRTATLLPYKAVRAMLIEAMSEVREYTSLMSRSCFASRTIIAGAPPPVRDDTLILELLKRGQITDPPSAPHVRLKLWLLQNQIYTELCHGTPLTYLPATPEGTQDAEGFLLPKFVKDAVHANGKWGAQYLTQAIALAASLEKAAND
jgi:hypothetical protein